MERLVEPNGNYRSKSHEFHAKQGVHRKSVQIYCESVNLTIFCLQGKSTIRSKNGKLHCLPDLQCCTIIQRYRKIPFVKFRVKTQDQVFSTTLFSTTCYLILSNYSFTYCWLMRTFFLCYCHQPSFSNVYLLSCPSYIQILVLFHNIVVKYIILLYMKYNRSLIVCG